MMYSKTTITAARSGLDNWSFRKVAPNGLGDPYNCYPHSMAWFQDHLYVGTTRANLASRAKQIQSNTPEKIGKVWPVRIPKSAFDSPLRAEIWRYSPAADEWHKLYTAPMAKGIDGFEVPISVGFRCMALFQGPGDSAPALYAPTWASHQTPATIMLKTSDGVNFTEVSEPGLGITQNTPRSLRGIFSFKGRLFTSPVVGQKRLEPNIAGEAVVYVSADPDHGAWQFACETSFGDPNNVSVFHMAASDKYIYAGTLNIYEGFQVWKTDAEGEPPFAWEKVVSQGAYRGKLNQMGMTLVHFNGSIYVGSAIQNCSWDHDYKVGPAAPEVIRINPDDSGDLIMCEPRMTPDGLKIPLSGLGPGFNNPFAGYIWSMCVHEGWLYVGNAVWANFLRYSDRLDKLPKILRIIQNRDSLEKILEDFGGCDLWRTRDGVNWRPVTINGFGNCFNIGFRNMVSSPYGLFVGAANPFAPEVAVNRLAGWTYEENPRGGLEIWFGSHEHGRPHRYADKALAPGLTGEKKRLPGSGDETDEETLARHINTFYGHSNFRHPGMWQTGIHDARSACENLMGEILAFIPDKQGRVLDVCADRGATTRRLLKYFPPQAVTGITANEKLRKACRQTAPEVEFVCGRMARRNLPEASFDTAIMVKGFFPLGARNRLFPEIFRLLRPGGRLVGFDVLYEPQNSPAWWRRIMGPNNHIQHLDAYEETFCSAGFTDPTFIDVTRACRDGFRKHMERYFSVKNIAGDINDDMLRKIRNYFIFDSPLVSRCFLVLGRRPESEAETCRVKEGIPTG